MMLSAATTSRTRPRARSIDAAVVTAEAERSPPVVVCATMARSSAADG
jgi:hypothetical protein